MILSAPAAMDGGRFLSAASGARESFWDKGLAGALIEIFILSGRFQPYTCAKANARTQKAFGTRLAK